MNVVLCDVCWVWIFVAIVSGCVRHDRVGLLVADLGRDDVVYYDIITAAGVRCNYTGLKSPTAVAVDAEDGIIFVTNYGSALNQGFIMRAALDGSAVVIVANSTNAPQSWGVVLDARHRHVYYTDARLLKIVRMDYDGRERVDVIAVDLRFPYAVIVDPDNNRLYWTDPLNDRIESSTLQGSERMIFVSGVNNTLKSPQGLAVDSCESRLLWCDSTSDEVKSIGLNGTDERLLAEFEDTQFVGLAVFGNEIFLADIYATETLSRRIRIMPRAGGPLQFFGAAIVAFPRGMALFKPVGVDINCDSTLPPRPTDPTTTSTAKTTTISTTTTTTTPTTTTTTTPKTTTTTTPTTITTTPTTTTTTTDQTTLIPPSSSQDPVTSTGRTSPAVGNTDSVNAVVPDKGSDVTVISVSVAVSVTAIVLSAVVACCWVHLRNKRLRTEPEYETPTQSGGENALASEYDTPTQGGGEHASASVYEEIDSIEYATIATIDEPSVAAVTQPGNGYLTVISRPHSETYAESYSSNNGSVLRDEYLTTPPGGARVHLPRPHVILPDSYLTIKVLGEGPHPLNALPPNDTACGEVPTASQLHVDASVTRPLPSVPGGDYQVPRTG